MATVLALFMSQLSVMTRSHSERSSLALVEVQPRNHIMKKLWKMAGTFFELQRDAGYFRLFLHEVSTPVKNGSIIAGYGRSQ
jgi:hypothetical protein